MSKVTSTASKTASKIYNVFSSLVGLGVSEEDKSDDIDDGWGNESDDDNRIEGSTKSGSNPFPRTVSPILSIRLFVFILLLSVFNRVVQ